MAASSSSSKPPAPTFEFTKRKRWSETLFSELSDTIVFVLSPTCKVLFCGAAIVGLLGWKEDQLVDSDLTNFIEDEDQDNFRWSFTESLRTGQDMFTYTRFKFEQPCPGDANDRTGQLFEVKGHTHCAEGQSEPQCFFLTAMPYPSRNVAMLNAFLDLRVENETLSQRINELKDSADVSSQPPEQHPPSSPRFSVPHYSQRFNDPPLVPNRSYSRGGTTQPYYSSSDPAAANIPGRTLVSKVEGIVLPPLSGLSAIGEEAEDNSHRKKKSKKALVGDEQRVCVTCGRTDSPEWRKGPLGPKTLCNACGLRWAKRSRKPDSDDSPVQPQGSGSKNRSDPGVDESSSNIFGTQRLTF